MLGLALLPTTIVAQPGTLKDQLVGTWALVSFGRTLNRSQEIYSTRETRPNASCGRANPLWDTGSAQGRPTLLAAIAEFEREMIRERTGEGRKRALANGVRFGPKPKLSDFQWAEAIKRRGAGETLATIAKSYAVDTSTICEVGPSRRSDPAERPGAIRQRLSSSLSRRRPSRLNPSRWSTRRVGSGSPA
jgi:hypothetical protein